MMRFFCNSIAVFNPSTTTWQKYQLIVLRECMQCFCISNEPPETRALLQEQYNVCHRSFKLMLKNKPIVSFPCVFEWPTGMLAYVVSIIIRCRSGIAIVTFMF